MNTTNLDESLRQTLQDAGAALVGYADLTILPASQRDDLPNGVAVAALHQPDVIQDIAHAPTQAYLDWYNLLNDRLDNIVSIGAQFLRDKGYKAVAHTRAHSPYNRDTLSTILPHKTVATRAGLGWIGKCALLVTPQYGSMVRLSSLTTDAPLTAALPIDKPRCGACRACVDDCPAHAPSGRDWSRDGERQSFFDARACEAYAREICLTVFHEDHTICGRCIRICPHTQRYIRSQNQQLA